MSYSRIEPFELDSRIICRELSIYGCLCCVTIVFSDGDVLFQRFGIKRLAYRIQEIAIGGLSTRSTKLMDEILESYGFDRYGCLGPKPVKVKKHTNEMHDRSDKTIKNSDASTINDDIGIVVHVPLTLKRRSGHTQLVMPSTDADDINFRLAHQEAIVIAISRAHRWRYQLEDGTYVSLTNLATHINQDISFTARLLRLTQPSPRVIEAIFAGEEPDGLSLNALTKLLPMIWEDQEAELRFSYVGCRVAFRLQARSSQTHSGRALLRR